MYLRVFFCLKNEITSQFRSKLTTVVALHTAGQQMVYLVWNGWNSCHELHKISKWLDFGSVDDSGTANEIVCLCRVFSMWFLFLNLMW